MDTQSPRDFDARVLGAETQVEHYLGCRSNGAVELWSIVGGGHIPNLDGLAHSKVD